MIAQEGRRTNLIVDMIFGDRCYFLFTTKDNSYQCCYDDGLNNYCQTSQKYKHRDDTKCLNQDQYSLRNDPTETQTCVLTIESVSEADSGHYISFNADHKELQACNLAFVKTEDEDEGQMCKKNNTVVVAEEGLRINLIVDVSLGERCYFVFTSRDNTYQCCYDGINNFCETSQKYERGNDTKCLNAEQYSLKMDPKETKTCRLLIESVHEAASGHYTSYNADHKEIHKCNLEMSRNEDEGQMCKKNNTVVVAKEGIRADLIVDVSLGEECYFVFTSRDNSYQCCYDGINNYCEASRKYERGNNSKCLTRDQYSLKIDPDETKTCSLLIEKVASGHYTSYNGDHKEIHECNLEVSRNSIVAGHCSALLVYI